MRFVRTTSQILRNVTNLWSHSNFTTQSEKELRLKLEKVASKYNKSFSRDKQLGKFDSTKYNIVLSALIKDRKFFDALEIYESIESITSLQNQSDLRNDDTILLGIEIYGALRRPNKAKEQAILISDKSFSAQVASRVIEAYSRNDKLLGAESIMFKWIEICSTNNAQLELLIKKLKSTNSDSKKLLNEYNSFFSSIKLDENALLNHLPDGRAWTSLARLYAGRHAVLRCMDLLDFFIPEMEAPPSNVGVEMEDREILFHYAIRSVCDAGGGDLRYKLQNILTRRDRFLTFLKREDRALHPRTLQHLVRHMAVFNGTTLPSDEELTDNIVRLVKTYIDRIPDDELVISSSAVSLRVHPRIDMERGLRGLVSTMVSRLCQVGKTSAASALIRTLTEDPSTKLTVGRECTDTIINSLCLEGRVQEAVALYNHDNSDSGDSGGHGPLVLHKLAEGLRKKGDLHTLAELLTRTSRR